MDSNCPRSDLCEDEKAVEDEDQVFNMVSCLYIGTLNSKTFIYLLVYLPVKITGSNIVVFCMLTLYFR